MTQQFLASGIPLFKASGIPAMDPNCCCGECDCSLADKAYLDSPWECISADYGAPSYKSTMTFTLTGTPLSRSYWTFAGGSWFQNCVGSNPPDPTGSWAFSLPSGTGFVKSYDSLTLACSDAGSNYYDYVCMYFQAGSLSCAETPFVVATWGYDTSSSAVLKTDPQPSTFGWTLRGSNCVAGGTTQGYREMSPVDYVGYPAWYYKTGMYIVGGVTYYCGTSCNILYCRPSCNTNYYTLTNNNVNGSIHNGVDYSGISCSIALT